MNIKKFDREMRRIAHRQGGMSIDEWERRFTAYLQHLATRGDEKAKFALLEAEHVKELRLVPGWGTISGTRNQVKVTEARLARLDAKEELSLAEITHYMMIALFRDAAAELIELETRNNRRGG